MAMDPRVVLDGLVFPEVPRWRDGQLWFSDFQLWLPDMTGQVIVIEGGGTARTVVEQVPGGPPTGLGWLPDGRLLLVAAAGRSVLALEPDGTLITHADLSAVTSYWCNDMVVDASGRAYVGSSDPHPPRRRHRSWSWCIPTGGWRLPTPPCATRTAP
jgi:sugar lactone lactonase YvrE